MYSTSVVHHFLFVAFVCSQIFTVFAVPPTNKVSKVSPELSVGAGKSYKPEIVSPRSTLSKGYGYPYNIAPTLTPLIHSRADSDENEAAPQIKRIASKVVSSDIHSKKSPLKKYKGPYVYGASRRQGLDNFEEFSMGKRFRGYKVPKYRNFDDLEARYQSRRIDISEPYLVYDYRPKSEGRPVVSPRDPYLSPSNEPSDAFHPTVPKVNSYSAPYGQRVHDSPSYDAGPYEDDLPYDDHPEDTYGSPGKYPSNGEVFGYEADYEIASNQPITGDIRKRLLDYAGASDLYEGEPDYLEQVVRNKNKYGHENDYYSYGGPAHKSSSYSEFPYVESKISLIKKSRAHRVIK